MENMTLFNYWRKVPNEAQKKITGGKLNGYSDINPVWRIQKLTEAFGPAGIGWYYEVTNKWLESSGTEVAAFVDVALYIKCEGEWSKPILGTGGSKFIATNKNGQEMSDECYKMATTDALSVACKMLGIGADIYWSQGGEYTKAVEQARAAKKAAQQNTEKTAEAKPTETAEQTEAPQPQAQPQTKYEGPAVSSEELPDPKPAVKKPATVSAEELKTLRELIIPADVPNFAGKTLGEVADANLSDLKTVAGFLKDKSFRNNVAQVYNTELAKKTA